MIVLWKKIQIFYNIMVVVWRSLNKMVWICETCNGKNNNSSVKCRIGKCHAPKPQVVLDVDEKKIIRDYCPKCKHHQNFVRKSRWSKKYKCPNCKRFALFHGEPVPEIVRKYDGVKIWVDSFLFAWFVTRNFIPK